MRTRTAVAGVALLLAATAGVVAQSTTTTQPRYLLPPQAVIDIVDAPALPLVEVSPARDVLAVLPRRDMPSIAEVSSRCCAWRVFASIRRTTAFTGRPREPAIVLRTIATGTERPVQVPAGARVGAFSFSPDGKRFSFTNTRDSRIDLYVGDVASGQTRLVDGAMNGVAGGCEWLDDSTALLCPLRAERERRRAQPRRSAERARTSRRTSESPVPSGRIRIC